MQYIDRSAVSPPAILLSENTKLSLHEIHFFLKKSRNYTKQRRAPIDESIIHNADVYSSLHSLFSGKCAYCETYTNEIIDHFRPSIVSETEGYSGHYSWLSYDWHNLYSSCIECSKRKGGLFPVKGRRATLFSSIAEARETENYLLIDPCHDDPRKHLTISPEGKYLPLDMRGEHTIKTFSLNRDSLLSSRKKVISQIEIDINKYLYSNTNVDKFIANVSPKQEHYGAVLQYISSLVKNSTGRIPSWKRKSITAEQAADSINKIDKVFLRESISIFSNGLDSRITKANSLSQSLSNDAHTLSLNNTFNSTLERFSLKHVTIRNFKGINDLTLSIPAYKKKSKTAGALMILGENAVGKSSVLQAISLASMDKSIDSKIKTEELLNQKGRDRLERIQTEELNIELHFYDRDDIHTMRIDPLSEAIERNQQSSLKILAYGPRRFTVKGANKQYSKFSRIRNLFDSSRPLPDPHKWLNSISKNDSEKFGSISKGLREILSLNRDDEVILDPTLGVCIRIHGRLEPIKLLSEGYRSLFTMSVDIMRELLENQPNLEDARGIVLIDEVETHLHPRWKMKIMSSLRHAMPSVTFIATTHDPLCLRGMEHGEIIVLTKDENQNISKIKELPDITGMRADQILTSEYFGLHSTADLKFEKQLADYAEAYMEKENNNKSFNEEGESIKRTIALGDTALDQIIQTALSKYLKQKETFPNIGNSRDRRDIVEHLLNTLRRPLED